MGSSLVEWTICSFVLRIYCLYQIGPRLAIAYRAIRIKFRNFALAKTCSSFNKILSTCKGRRLGKLYFLHNKTVKVVPAVYYFIVKHKCMLFVPPWPLVRTWNMTERYSALVAFALFYKYFLIQEKRGRFVKKLVC